MNFPVAILKDFGLALLVTSVSACASPHGARESLAGGEQISSTAQIVQPTSMMLIELDADRDRLLTREELASGADAEWRVVAEAAGTEELRPVDFSRWIENAIGTKDTPFTHIAVDTDANGSISDIEFRGALEREFNIADRDKDGVVTRAELVNSVQARQRSQSHPARGDGRQQRRGGRRPPRN